jgi:hypothetical protein
MVTGHFRLETKIIGRKAKDKNGHAIPGRQSSVVAKAAYRSGQMLHEDRAEKTFNYRSRTQGLGRYLGGGRAVGPGALISIAA